jgi:epsilon-lactone hydrolase
MVRRSLSRWFLNFGGVLVCSFVMQTGAAWSQSPAAPPPLKVDADGTVHVPAMAVPPSEYLSPQGKAYLAQHLQDVTHPERLAQHGGVPVFMAGYLARQEALYPVIRQETTVGGVHAYVYTPKSGVSATNAKRVLIDLHGGGFQECWPGCAELESIPIAALARIKVVTLDYREAPKYRFPAASEDVAAAYKELLKTYRPQDIGIYGCSAGGMLTGEATAWFQTHGLPRPGAIGIFCAGMTMGHAAFGGDANYMSAPIGEARFLVPPQAKPEKGPPKSGLKYFEGANLGDPMVAPANSLAVLAKFPPTLIVTGTRGFEMSSAVYTHSLLVKEGVDADLHVWEGMFHGFFYNPDTPESRDCYNVIVRFFDRHLGK